MTINDGRSSGATDVLAALPADLPTIERLAVLPGGFAAGAMAAGIKASGRPDLSVVRTTNGPAAAAAVFTQHPFAAAPVQLSRASLRASAPAGSDVLTSSQICAITSSRRATTPTIPSPAPPSARSRAPAGTLARSRMLGTWTPPRPWSSHWSSAIWPIASR